jgi:ornithine cyclodeaminase
LSTHEAAKVNILEYSEITKGVDLGVAIEVMRQALLAQASGECDTPMPMHLDIEPTRGEVHIKASARRGAPYYVVKVASGFPDNSSKGLSTGNGLMMLFSAETGQAEAMLLDQGYLTDVRTAAVTALMARELGRRDKTIGILGSGIQARLQVDLHREVLDLEQVWIWGRTPAHVTACAVDLRDRHPDLMISIADSPSQVAEMSRPGREH